MTKPKLTKAEQIKDLERKLLETQAQLAHVYHFAGQYLVEADRHRTLGSGILVRLNYLGGKQVCNPFVLKDGFSPETIAALLAELKYSYDKTIEFKPLEPKP